MEGIRDESRFRTFMVRGPGRDHPVPETRAVGIDVLRIEEYFRTSAERDRKSTCWEFLKIFVRE